MAVKTRVGDQQAGMAVPESGIPENAKLSGRLQSDKETLLRIFERCGDLKMQPYLLPNGTEVLIVYFHGMTQSFLLEQLILNPLLSQSAVPELLKGADLAQHLQMQVLRLPLSFEDGNIRKISSSLLTGHVCILLDGSPKAILAAICGSEHRSIEEPSSELSLRGPRAGFIEDIVINSNLMRIKLRSERLKIEYMTIGSISNTMVAVVYLSGVVNETVLQEVRRRLSEIKLDAVLDSGLLEEWLEEKHYSPFPQLQNTERPDVLAANLLEGKVGIMADGSPFALIAPYTFWGGIQASEDYYERFIYTSLIRALRMLLLFLSLTLPSIYVAITTFHPQMMPTDLLLSFSSATEPSPFPAIIEALIMEFLFEALREAGIRLPKHVGSAISIVGALVIGQAAVQAGVISAPMVIVVSITGIASFAIPRYSFGIGFRMLRFPLLFLSGMFGLVGLGVGLVAILCHLVNLRSFGVLYFSPVAPLSKRNLNDVIVRVPRWLQPFLPKSVAGGLKRRGTV
ncbi:spore germination protein [Paenibacillus humicola]|uniref:spore germination protein n=1 Tax=Paenibacillus humicola TaxID=3110540 RepID=UPI00237B844E|nr:spore germination protein [Paenibacillus humicola]